MFRGRSCWVAAAAVISILLVSSGARADEIIIGTGTGGWEMPLRTDYQEARTQIIYLASEIGSAFDISALALGVGRYPLNTMDNFTIRLKHTSLSTYSSSVFESTGWTTVYQANQTISTMGWVQFDFSTPFSYDGIQNLMVDISFDSSSYDISGSCKFSSPGGVRSVFGYCAGMCGSPLTWPAGPGWETSAKVPNIRLTGTRVVATPIFGTSSGAYHSEQNVVITCATAGATIRYTTNGIDPNESDPVIASGGSAFIDHDLTLKAKAWKGVMSPSDVQSATYTFVTATPVFSPGAGTYHTDQNVVVTCATPGATIHYTTNGAEPTENDPVVASGGSINVTHSMPLKARAWRSGWAASSIQTAYYWLQVATPVLSPGGGKYAADQTVTVTCSTPGAEMHYTLDNSLPTGASPIVANGGSISVPVEPTTVLKVRGFKTGYLGSNAGSGVYRAGSMIFYVSPSGHDWDSGQTWATAKATLQAALDAAVAGDEIWVVGGTYKPTQSVAGGGITFQMKNGVGIYGGFAGNETDRGQRDCKANATILSGDLDGSGTFTSGDAQYIFYLPSSLTLDSSAVLDGFTITGGNGTGILCQPGSPTIANCDFTNNSGIALLCEGGTPSLTGCRFEANGSGNAYEGAIICFDDIDGLQRQLTATNCEFVRNHDAGIDGFMYDLTFRNCSFKGHRCYGSGAVHMIMGNITAVNCVFVGNENGNGMPPYMGGQAIYCESGNVTTIGCTFAGNRGNGSDIIVESGTWSGPNCVFPSSNPMFVREPSIGPDGITGTVDDDYGDLRLRAGSPCIDAGSNAAVPPDVTTDILGNPRIFDGNGDGTATVDGGAYERQCVANPVGDVSYDCCVEFADYAMLVGRWGQSGCAAGNWWCYWADVDQSGVVNMMDLSLLAANWLQGI